MSIVPKNDYDLVKWMQSYGIMPTARTIKAIKDLLIQHEMEVVQKMMSKVNEVTDTDGE